MAGACKLIMEVSAEFGPTACALILELNLLVLQLRDSMNQVGHCFVWCHLPELGIEGSTEYQLCRAWD